MRQERMIGHALVMHRRPTTISRRLPDTVIDRIARIDWILAGSITRHTILREIGYPRLRISAEMIRQAARYRKAKLDSARLALPGVPIWLWSEIGVVNGWDTAHIPLLSLQR